MEILQNPKETKWNVIEVDSYKGFKVGDTIHIKRWYTEEGSKDFNRMGNWITVNVTHSIDKITIDLDTGIDCFWCGIFSTSSEDIANKGIKKNPEAVKKF